MAEFIKVMNQAQRMCKSFSGARACDSCPAGGCGECAFTVSPEYRNDDQFAKIERIVIDWAAEHPEPRYPRWVDVLYEMGVFRNEVHNGNVHTCCLTDEAYAPIPADIAEKLGIKPIGGDEHGTDDA